MFWRAFVLAALAALPSTTAKAQGDLQQLLAILPDEVVAVAAAADPAAATRALTELLEPVPPGLPATSVAQIGLALTALRAALQGATAAWVERLAGGGAVVALLPSRTGGGWQLLAVTRPGDLVAAQSWCAQHVTGLHHAVVGDQLLLARSAAGLELLRARANAPAGRWAGVDLAPSAGEPAALLAHVDLVALRRLLGARSPALERLGGTARVLLAPIVHALATAPWLHAELTASATGLRLVVDADGSVRETPFGALLAADARAGARLQLPVDGMSSLTLDRSFRALFRDPARFLPADGVQAVQGFLSIADTLDGARSSFVDDLLGGLREPMTLQVLAPTPAAADDADRSPILLPEFVLCAEVADQAAGDGWLRAAQVLATIVNAERVQRRQTPFVVRRRQDDTGHGLVAEPRPWRGPGLAPVDRQLSPTLWIGGGRLVLASTWQAAQASMRRPFERTQAAAADQLLLRGSTIAAVIAANRAVLALGRQLDEGEDLATAERVLATVEALAAAIAELRLQVVVAAATTRLQIELERRR